MGLLDDEELLKAAFGNTKLARQVARTRALQAARSNDVNTLPDPQTYAFIQGLLGEAPDQMGFSPMNPDYAKIMGRGEQGMLAGTVSMVGPTAKAIKGLAGLGARALGPTAVGMGEGYLQSKGLMPQLDVYHGSPHKFDRFDASKIGTGEGAQAYGHGIYTAEAPATAIEYQKKLSSTGSAKNLANQYGGVDEGLAEAKRRVESYKQLIADGGGGAMSRAKSMLQISEKNVQDLEAIKAGLPENTGNFYKVDLPDEQIAKMLDFDKQLSEQSAEVKNILLPYQKEIGGSFGTGEQTLKAIAFERRMKGLDDSPAAVAQQLRDMGIPGIKYLDATSRGAGTGTRNFVTFPGEEQNLTILERNGQPMIARTQQQDATPDLLQYQQMLDEEERRKSAGLLFR